MTHCPHCGHALHADTDLARTLRAYLPPVSRLQRCLDRLDDDRDRAYLSGSAWSARDRQLRTERMR